MGYPKGQLKAPVVGFLRPCLYLSIGAGLGSGDEAARPRVVLSFQQPTEASPPVP